MRKDSRFRRVLKVFSAPGKASLVGIGEASKKRLSRSKESKRGTWLCGIRPHARTVIFLLPLLAFAAGCSTHMSSLRADDGRSVIYVGEESAIFNAAYFAMYEVFPNSPIQDVDGPIRGFSVLRRFLSDWYRTQVRIVPASGLDKRGTRQFGYYFEVSGQGTYSTGPYRDRQVVAVLGDLISETMTPVEVTMVERGEYEYDRDRWRLRESEDEAVEASNQLESLASRLRQLEDLLENELITDEEYAARREKILEEI